MTGQGFAENCADIVLVVGRRRDAPIGFAVLLSHYHVVRGRHQLLGEIAGILRREFSRDQTSASTVAGGEVLGRRKAFGVVVADRYRNRVTIWVKNQKVSPNVTIKLTFVSSGSGGDHFGEV